MNALVDTDNSTSTPQGRSRRFALFIPIARPSSTETPTEGANTSTRSPRGVLLIVFSVGGGNGAEDLTPSSGDPFENILNRLFLTHQSVGAPPASQKAIETLKTIKIDAKVKQEAIKCCVCCEEFEIELPDTESQNEVVELPCQHVYHRDCIIPWLKQHGTCCLCRQELSGEEEKPNEESATTSSTTNDEIPPLVSENQPNQEINLNFSENETEVQTSTRDLELEALSIAQFLSLLRSQPNTDAINTEMDVESSLSTSTSTPINVTPSSLFSNSNPTNTDTDSTQNEDDGSTSRRRRRNPLRWIRERLARSSCFGGFFRRNPY